MSHRVRSVEGESHDVGGDIHREHADMDVEAEIAREQHTNTLAGHDAVPRRPWLFFDTLRDDPREPLAIDQLVLGELLGEVVRRQLFDHE